VNRDPALEGYFAEAISWDADRATQHRRVLRLAFLVAGAGWGCAVVMGLALTILMPLKRVEPFLIRVDNSTGLVDVVPVYAGQASMPEAVTRYFLDHYVTVCERFDFATAESDYEECGAFHTAARNQAWYERWARTNPASPLNLYKDGSSLRAQVSAVSFFERGSGVSDLAQVRYTKAKRPTGGAEEQVTHWIATVQYTYAEPSKDPKVRRWNPLGFKIIEFRSEPEVLTEPDAAPARAVTASDPAVAGRAR
jgi:type IV secretion system protein VirB8